MLRIFWAHRDKVPVDELDALVVGKNARLGEAHEVCARQRPQFASFQERHDIKRNPTVRRANASVKTHAAALANAPYDAHGRERYATTPSSTAARRAVMATRL